MNFILKTVISKVFKKYLNLQEQINIQQGSIKLPFGRLNHQQINKKLIPFNISISSSVYKNLSITIPLTQIVSKPIKISIEQFQVRIGKLRKNHKQGQEVKNEQLDAKNKKQQNQESNEKEKEKAKDNKNSGKNGQIQVNEQNNSGYIKNMVNRLLYNMEIVIEKVIIKMQDNEQDKKDKISSYLSEIEFEITRLHLRNSLVLLEANIVKKIFNLQQIMIKHKFGQFIIKDFNICIDYNNKKLNIMAILGKININIKQILLQQITKFLENSKIKTFHSQQITKQNQNKNQIQQNSKKFQKSIDLKLYIKLNHFQLQIQNLITLKGQSIQCKYKYWRQVVNKSYHEGQSNKQFQLYFKQLFFVHQDRYEIKDFLIVRYLPRSQEVKTFSQYEDNVIKTSVIKIKEKNGIRRQSLKQNKNQVQIKSSTSFEQRNDEQVQNHIVQRELRSIVGHVFYVDLMIDLQVIQKMITKFMKRQQYRNFIKAISSINEFGQTALNNESGFDGKQKNKIYTKISSNKQSQTSNNKLTKQNIIIELTIYRIMVNVKLSNQNILKVYGSLKAKYYKKQLSYLQNQILISQTISKFSHSKDSFSSQQVQAHLGKHTHKKRNSNKQKLNPNEKQNQKKLHKLKSHTKIQHNKNTTLFNQVLREESVELQLLQLCAQFKQYNILNLSSFQAKFLKKYKISHNQNQIVITGSSINSNISIKLIKDIIKLIQNIQKQIEQINQKITQFKRVEKVKETKLINIDEIEKEKRKEKIYIFLKLNELKVKFGSLIKQNRRDLMQIHKKNYNFIWIFLLQLSNISLGIKNLNTIKAKFSIMSYICSPQTLHIDSLMKNQVIIKFNYKPNQQILISVNNDLLIDIDQNKIQILAKYFGQLIQKDEKKNADTSKMRQNDYKDPEKQWNENKEGRQNSEDEPKRTIEKQQRISDNECFLVQFYNSLQKQVKFIQVNEYEISEDSINLSELDQNQSHQTIDPKYQQRQIILQKQTKQIIFWLNQFQFSILIDNHKSCPISLEFQPIPIIQTKRNFSSRFFYQYQSIITFQDSNEKYENKYVIHFLLNSIGKIQKIILKDTACFMSYNNLIQIVHQTNNSMAFSNLVLSPTKQKITEQSLIQNFRILSYKSAQLLKNKLQHEINYQLFLDLNQQSKHIKFILNQQEAVQSYNVSSILIRSPNQKKQNKLYSLFGIYSQKQIKKTKKQEKTTETLLYKIFQYYLYQIKHLQTNYFVMMPFLIIENNLACDVQLQICDKKSHVNASLVLKKYQTKDIYPSSFKLHQGQIIDFYNKQFILKIKLISYAKSQYEEQQREEKNMIVYQSEGHYFNTFFMVQHEFETLIALRSNLKYQYDKKYFFLREQLMLKTKVLKLQSSCKIINKTKFNFGLKLKRGNEANVMNDKKRLEKYESSKHQNRFESSQNRNLNIPSKSNPKKSESFESPLKNQRSNFQRFITSQYEEENNHYFSKGNSQMSLINQLRSSETLQILFQNLSETKIQVKQQSIKEGLISVLSFNFAQKQNDPHSNAKNQNYCHLLFRLRIKTIQNHQFIVIQNFITFKNLTLERISLNFQQNYSINTNQDINLPLPPTTNKRFNNTLITLNNISEIQILYEQLFFSNATETQLLKNSKIKNVNILQIEAQIEQKKKKLSCQIIIKGEQDKHIDLRQLLQQKNNAKEVKIEKKGMKVFSLLKDIKNGIIKFFFIQKLFNPSLSYLVIENKSKDNFLISSDQSQYSHHFIKSTAKSKQLSDQITNVTEQMTEKIFVEQNSYNIVTNKENIEIFFCDQNGKHLQKSNKQNLQKQGLVMQFHNIGNFKLISINEAQTNSDNEAQQVSKKVKLSINTCLISLNLNLYNKLFLNLSISNINLRLLDQSKIDCLIQDVSLKNIQNGQQILRIPEQSYILFEGKIVGSQASTKFILIKNIFLKCKNLIVNIEKDLPYKVICLCRNLLPKQNILIDENLTKKEEMEIQFYKSVYQALQMNEALQKLKKYLKQRLFLVKNIYIHEIHLSINLDVENNNFSNVMVIPNFQLVNKFMRENNLFKEIGQFYKVNIIAKLPKLSFIFQNLKNPINLFRTMIKVGSALNQKIQLKNVLFFDHDQLPQNYLNFSLQRWNIIHQKNLGKLRQNKENNKSQQYLAYLFKNDFYYIVSNYNFIIICLNSKSIPKDEQIKLIHFENNSQERIQKQQKREWRRGCQNSMIRTIDLKDIQKIKLIKNKKYCEMTIQFKRNLNVSICDEYEKCAKLIDVINNLVM